MDKLLNHTDVQCEDMREDQIHNNVIFDLQITKKQLRNKLSVQGFNTLVRYNQNYCQAYYGSLAVFASNIN